MVILWSVLITVGGNTIFNIQMCGGWWHLAFLVGEIPLSRHGQVEQTFLSWTYPIIRWNKIIDGIKDLTNCFIQSGVSPLLVWHSIWIGQQTVTASSFYIYQCIQTRFVFLSIFFLFFYILIFSMLYSFFLCWIFHEKKKHSSEKRRKLNQNLYIFSTPRHISLRKAVPTRWIIFVHNFQGNYQYPIGY